MTKRALFSLTNLLAPHIRHKNTNYQFAVPIVVRVACALFKLSHGSSLLIYSEMFAMGRSSYLFLREVVQTVNVVLKHEISWPRRETIGEIVDGFKQLCGLPGVLEAVDGIHFGIKKSCFGSADCYYFKTGLYTINCQAVVDSSKRFLDIFVGIPGYTNDTKCCAGLLFLRKEHQMICGIPIRNLKDIHHTFSGILDTIATLDHGPPSAATSSVSFRTIVQLSSVAWKKGG